MPLLDNITVEAPHCKAAAIPICSACGQGIALPGFSAAATAALLSIKSNAFVNVSIMFSRGNRVALFLLWHVQCGWLTDRYNRVHLLFLVIIIGEAPCLCTYWVSGESRAFQVPVVPQGAPIRPL